MTDRKRLLFFSHMAREGPLTGAEKTLLTMIRELVSRHDCTLVLPGPGLLDVMARKAGCKTVIFPYASFSRILSRNGFPAGALGRFHERQPVEEITRLIQHLAPHLTVVNTAVNTVPAAAAGKAGVPVLWWMQEVVPRTHSLPDFLSFVSSHADSLLGLSEATLSFLPLLDRPIPSYRLPPAWEDSPLHPASWSGHRRRIRTCFGIKERDLAVGFVSVRATRNKGFHHFLRLMRLLPLHRYPVHFLIRSNVPGGPDALRRLCLRSMSERHHVGRVHLLPRQRDIQHIYPAMDLLVVPSLVEEGFGLTALEGMAFGKPVIAYRSGGLEQIFRLTRNDRFLVDRADVAALARKTLHLLKSPLLRAAVGRKNAAAIRRMFGFDHYRQRLFSMFDDELLCQGKGNPP